MPSPHAAARCPTAARAPSSSLARPCTSRLDSAPHETSRARPNQRTGAPRARTRTNLWPSCLLLARASRTQRGSHRNRREARPRPATCGEFEAEFPTRTQMPGGAGADGKPRRFLLCSRRDFDPHLWAPWSRRVVSFGARAVVPVRLRLLVHDDGRWLYHDLRRVVVGRVVIRRVTPPRTPPGTGDDDAVPMKVAVESVVPVKSMASVASAAMATPSVARLCGNDQERKGEEGRYNYPTHTTYLAG